MTPDGTAGRGAEMGMLRVHGGSVLRVVQPYPQTLFPDLYSPNGP